MHIYYNNFTWVYEDVTYKAGGADTPMNLGSGIAAFKVPTANQFEVWSITDDTHLNRYTHVVKPSQWIDYDLTNGIGAPTDSQFGGIVAFVTVPDNQYHIYYAPSDVYHVYYNGTAWGIEDLTGGVVSVDDSSGMAGFPTYGNWQNLFFMAPIS